MIEIQGIGLFDPSKPFFKQEDENVRNYINDKTSEFNDFTAILRDSFNRPVSWEYIGEGVRLTSERTYSTQDFDYNTTAQTFNIEQHGNI